MTNNTSRKALASGIIILFVIISFVPSITSSSILILGTIGNSAGNKLYVGGNGSGNYSNIQSAINNARSGDTIFVYDDSSPYYENIVISKSINLTGENRYTTTIDGGGIGHVIHVSADRINISDFSIRNSGNNAGVSINSDYNIISDVYINNNNYGILVENSHDNIVKNNKITNNNYGIYLYDSSNTEIYDNTITDNSVGIQLYRNSKYNIIHGNDITNSDYGINLDFSSYNNIYWNIITDSRYGIYLHDSSNNDLHDDNIITNNHYGIYFYRSSNSNVYGDNIIKNNKYGICLYDSSNINIHENEITNSEIGVNLNASSNNDIYWNNIRYNKNGVYITYSTNNNVFLNAISENYQIGLYIYFSRSTKIVYNNFISNLNQAYFKQSFFSFNIWKQNYWDDWKGTGSQRINGELEGLINQESWFNYDFRPVREPYEI